MLQYHLLGKSRGHRYRPFSLPVHVAAHDSTLGYQTEPSPVDTLVDVSRTINNNSTPFIWCVFTSVDRHPSPPTFQTRRGNGFQHYGFRCEIQYFLLLLHPSRCSMMLFDNLRYILGRIPVHNRQCKRTKHVSAYNFRLRHQ